MHEGSHGCGPTPECVCDLGVWAVLVEPQDERGPLPIRQLRERVQDERRLRCHDVRDELGEVRAFTTVPPMMRPARVHHGHAEIGGWLADPVPVPDGDERTRPARDPLPARCCRSADRRPGPAAHARRQTPHPSTDRHRPEGPPPMPPPHVCDPTPRCVDAADAHSVARTDKKLATCRSHRRSNDLSALGGTRTPNLLIRSQMLYPLSYERLGRSVYGSPSVREIGSAPLQPTVWPYISPSGSLISSRRAPSGSLK